MNRRQFIESSAIAGSGLATPLTHVLKSPLRITSQPGFELLIFATNWGFKGNIQSFAQEISKAGYDGAELWLPADKDKRKEVVDIFQDEGLQLGFLIGGHADDFPSHFHQFEESLKAAVELNPVYVNCHSGRDFFSRAENDRFIESSLNIIHESGVPVYHETHRSRILYAASIAKDYLTAYPNLRLTLDISHWCNVHESLLQNQQTTVDIALDRTDHIHARVGHPEGPQVTDPRAPEWEECVKAHFAWWDKVVAKKKSAGERLTILTEFGPPDYLPTVPYTRQPLANQWDINQYMLNTLRARYQ